MELGLMTEPHVAGSTYEDLLRAARLAEESGLVAFFRSDHYYSPGPEPTAATDAFATLAGLARETDRVRLGVLVTPITFRHPAVITKLAATIDQMAGGRLELGVGTGWMEEEHEVFGLPFPGWEERFSRLEETLRYLRAAFAEGVAHVDGPHYRLGPVEVLPKPVQRPSPPIIVGGSGPRRTPELAGTYADEYNQQPAPPPVLAERISVARTAASRAGRDPGALRCSWMGQVVVGTSQASYRERLEAAAAARGRGPEEHQARLRDRGALVGTPREVSETLAGLVEAGIERLYVQHLTNDLSPLPETFEELHSAL